MLILTVVFLDLFLRITNKIIITKNQHQKQHVVWTAPFWIIVGTFTASHGKIWTNPPPIFLNDSWHVVNVDLHIFVSWSFLKRNIKRKIITKHQHQKQHVVWTAPFWVIVDTFTASHGKCEQISHLSYLFKWFVTCGKFWSSHVCFSTFF